jgi:Tfp pilus assembly protein PilF
LGQNSQGGSDYSEALRLGSNVHDTNLARGKVRLRQGDFAGARADFSEALRVKPASYAALAQRGEAAAAAGDYVQAVRDFEAAVAIYPLDATANCGLALLRATCPEAGLRDGKQAVDLARIACKQSPKESRCHLALAAAYAETGEFVLAQQELGRAYHLPHNDPAAVAALQARFAAKEAFRGPLKLR